MSRVDKVLLAVVAGAVVLLTGCVPKMTVAQMKADMPKRPIELDQLKPFVGNWQYEGTMKFTMLDQPLKISSRMDAQWSDDNWFVVQRGTSTTEQLGDSQAVETWTFDPHAKKFRSVWMRSMAMSGSGTGTYDAKTRTWHFAGTEYTAWGSSTMQGTMHMVDNDTIEITASSYMGLTKILDMKMTGKRVSAMRR